MNIQKAPPTHAVSVTNSCGLLSSRRLEKSSCLHQQVDFTTTTTTHINMGLGSSTAAPVPENVEDWKKIEVKFNVIDYHVPEEEAATILSNAQTFVEGMIPFVTKAFLGGAHVLALRVGDKPEGARKRLQEYMLTMELLHCHWTREEFGVALYPKLLKADLRTLEVAVITGGCRRCDKKGAVARAATELKCLKTGEVVCFGKSTACLDKVKDLCLSSFLSFPV